MTSDEVTYQEGTPSWRSPPRPDLVIPRPSASVLVGPRHFSSRPRRDADRRATTRSALGNTKITKRNAKLNQNLHLITSPPCFHTHPLFPHPLVSTAHTHHHQKIKLDNVIKKCYQTRTRQKRAISTTQQINMTIRQTSELSTESSISFGLIKPIV